MGTSDVLFDVKQQFTEEIGPTVQLEHKAIHRSTRSGQLLFDSGCPACKAGQSYNALRQKYGLLPPQMHKIERDWLQQDAHVL